LTVRLGLLGGSFDPPHIGHLLAAIDAFEGLELDRLVFVPAAVQPLKAGKASASAAQRLEMVRQLVLGDPRFTVDPIETERGGVSFSVDTVAAYSQRNPSAELFFLVGADVVGSFESWREPDRIAALATIVVVDRGDDPSKPAGRLPVRHLRTRRIDVSSTEIRERVKAGQSIHGFTTPAVADYIAATGLYR
jgi:nicotinate-nucleotide adenylyltransferase